MGQDIKDLLKKEQLHIQKGLSDGHEARFLERLETALPQEEKEAKADYVLTNITKESLREQVAELHQKLLTL